MDVVNRSGRALLLVAGLGAGLVMFVGCRSGQASGDWAKGRSSETQRTVAGPLMYPYPKAVCFAEGTPDEVRFAANQWAHHEPGPLAYYLGNRWSGASNGTPIELTWSLVPDGTWIPSTDSGDNGGVGAASELFAEMDSKFGGNRAQWIQIIQDCFDRWESLTGVSYTRITYDGEDWDDGAAWGSGGSSTRGAVRISMRNIDGAYGVLAYNFFPDNGDMVLDASDDYASSSNSYRFMRNIIMHEHGHGLGLEHVCPANSTKLMEPYITSSYTGPRHDDIRAIHEFYGDPYESDNNWITATDVGTLVEGSPIILGPTPSPSVPSGSLLSIDNNGEQDFFRIGVEGPSQLDVTVIPVGVSYDSSEQDWYGNCLSGNIVDSTEVADLELAVYDTDGTTLLGFSISGGAGELEMLSDVPLDEAGDYFVRVYEGNFPSDSQLYRLLLSVTDAECGLDEDCDDGAFCNGAETCDGTMACQSGTAPEVDDLIACTTDYCDEDADEVVHDPNDAACDDGNECTLNTCTLGVGCETTSTNEGGPCDAGSGPGSGICDDGTCVLVGQPCEDSADCAIANNNVCEWDYCNTKLGVCDTPIPMLYADVCGASYALPPNGAVNTTDVLCTLQAFGVGNLVYCPNADIAGPVPLPASCPYGNGVVNLTDVLKVLDAFGAPGSPSSSLACDCPLNP